MSLCTKCNEFYGSELSELCSKCHYEVNGVEIANNIVQHADDQYDTVEELHKYMKENYHMYDYIILSDQQFDMTIMTKLNEEVPPKEWYKLLNGLTQEFPHVLLTAEQVKKLIGPKTNHEYVNIVYNRCYEPWDADVKNSVGNCYWRELGEMKRPTKIEKLHKIFERLFDVFGAAPKWDLGECPICFDGMNTHDVWATTCCHNGIHRDCLLRCPDCPLCRGKYVKMPEEHVDNDQESLSDNELAIAMLEAMLDQHENFTMLDISEGGNPMYRPGTVSTIFPDLMVNWNDTNNENNDNNTSVIEESEIERLDMQTRMEGYVRDFIAELNDIIEEENSDEEVD